MPENSRQGSRHDHDRNDRPQHSHRADGASNSKNSTDKDETKRGYAEEGLFLKLVEADETAARHVKGAVNQLLRVLCEDLLEQVKKITLFSFLIHSCGSLLNLKSKCLC
jgi:hypothetical protein